MSEPPKSSLRLVLNLGKFRVTERNNASIKIDIGGSVSMTVTIPPNADVRAGDLLTFYTEVLYAQPGAAPIQ